MREIDHLLDSLPDDCGIVLNPEQQRLLREKIVSYAVAVMIDSSIRHEVDQICEEANAKHEWRRLDTGIGFGGYKECVKCWQTTYSDMCPKCLVRTPITDVCAGKRVCKCRNEQ